MLDAVGLRLHPDAGFLDEPSYDTASASSPHFKEVRRRLADTGLAVLDVEVVRLLPEIQAAHYKPLMEMAADLGAGYVIATGGDPNEARMTDNIGKLCALAAPHGLNVMLEFVRYAEVRSIAQAHRIITASGATNGKILIDTLHIFRAGETPEGVKAFDPSLFPYIQISDGPLTPPSGDGIRIEGRSNRMFPGEGGLPLAELLSALPDSIPLSVEVANDRIAQTHSAAERAKRAANSLNALLAGITAAQVTHHPSKPTTTPGIRIDE